MSGLGTPKITKEAKLPSRDIAKEPNELPMRTSIDVHSSVGFNNGNVLARVKKKFQIAGAPTLSFEISMYASTLQFNGIDSVDQKSKQLLQTMLHEMMHMALWDDLTISHSQDSTSLLYYYVDGSNITPNLWDIDVMKAAAQRIGNVRITTSGIAHLPHLMQALGCAVALWNEWIGRNYFELL